MAAEDHAVIIGINRYRSFEDLRGPENDVRAVAEWLRDPAGGDVPAAQIREIVSADFGPEPRPVAEDIYAAFEALMDLAEGADPPRPAGRRLYIFMAGHGFGPTLREAALLMANAAPRRWGHSVDGGAVADYFGRAAYFEEVVLLMDCCRDDLAVAQAPGLPWQGISGEPRQPVRWLYGFAACFQLKAREQIIEGEWRGVFTAALLEALRSGAMTSRSLESLVTARMAELTGPDAYQRPHFQPGPEDFDFGPAISRPMLRISLTPGVGEAWVDVGQGEGSPPISHLLKAGEIWEVPLVSGLYEIVRQKGGDPLLVKLTVGIIDVEI